jgi:hypothetical protein
MVVHHTTTARRTGAGRGTPVPRLSREVRRPCARFWRRLAAAAGADRLAATVLRAAAVDLDSGRILPTIRWSALERRRG